MRVLEPKRSTLSFAWMLVLAGSGIAYFSEETGPVDEGGAIVWAIGVIYQIALGLRHILTRRSSRVPTRRKQESLVDDLTNLRKSDLDKYHVWEYFSNHADDLTDGLWTTGTWLIGLQLALLAYIVSQGFAVFEASTLRIAQPILVLYASVIGALLCIYSIAVVVDYSNHIRDNWTRQNQALGRGEAKSSPLWTLGGFLFLAVTAAAMLAYGGLIVVSIWSL